VREYFISDFLGDAKDIDRFMRSSSFLYYLGRFLFKVVFKIGWRLRIEGSENIPEKGPAIIASNHRSFADPPLVGVGVKRTVHFLAKKELFSFRPFGWLIRKLNAHPLDRASGISALRAAEDILGEGGLVILFPEGRRSSTDELQKPKAGVGMLALRAQVPVIPAYIHNSGHIREFQQLQIKFGPPVDSKKFDSYEDLAREVMRQIQKMKDQVTRKI
jgi:1-acyl-sn-glycerol-3-phosphate acyltransferase